jgi:haloacetate dehalogenase
MVIPGFADAVWTGGPVPIAYSIGGAGPPLLLLHGFPQSRALWARIGPALARHRTVIAPDLRGYGGSGKPAAVDAYSFRAMAADMVGLMKGLGHDRFAIAGHDRGGRVAHRLALDAPEAVARLCVMDIVPTRHLLTHLTAAVARDYYHWFFLAQPAPGPERMIGADPDAFFESCLTGWGAAGLADFDPAQLAAYRAAWRDADTVRGMCNDYRAALSHDAADDAADAGRAVRCPALVLWGADGAMARHYDVAASWAPLLARMTARALPGGHFFPDTAPGETAAALAAFLDHEG